MRFGRLQNQATQDCEQELIERILKGEHELFCELIYPYERRLRAIAFGILRNEADADDCAQDATPKAFQNIHQFRAEARFSTWLIQIAIHEARMRKRKQRAHPLEPIKEDEGEDGSYTPREFADWREIPSEVLERKEVREKLDQALNSLGEIYRQVFVLRDVQNISIARTAKALGISTASVKTRLLRARIMMRDLLAPGLGGPWDLSPSEGANPCWSIANPRGMRFRTTSMA